MAKSVLLLSLALLFQLLPGAVQSLDFEVQSLDFEVWVREHGKRYATEAERAVRMQVFEENVGRVARLNEQHQSNGVKFELNYFADLSPAEFKSSVLLKTQSPPVFPVERYAPLPSLPQALPDTFDWREKGVVSSVKDQGSARTCWAFSTVGNVESQWALAGHNVTSLSVEQLVDCDATLDPSNMHQDCGVSGGWPYLAYQYIEKTGGIEPEAQYPYCSGTESCFPCAPPGYNTTRCGPTPSYCNKTQGCTGKLDPDKFVSGLKVKTWVAVAKNESVMQSELVSRGPLSVLMNANKLQFYNSGVLDPASSCNPYALDHALLLVGYGTNEGLTGSKPYWLIKNSWGARWGMDGYFMLIRGKGECGINLAVTSAVLG